jgi:peptidylprolyl isomerase domain and WD repeat-containing protein 1
MNGFSDLAVNYNGTLLATISADDKTAKIFDITNFDMINILTLNFRPAAIAWVSQGSDIVHSLAIADLDSPAIHVYDGKGNELLHTIKGVHFKPVTKIDVSPLMNK